MISEVKENEKKITGRECEFFNGFGGFVADGREYEILLQDDNMPPARTHGNRA